MPTVLLSAIGLSMDMFIFQFPRPGDLNLVLAVSVFTDTARALAVSVFTDTARALAVSVFTDTAKDPCRVLIDGAGKERGCGGAAPTCAGGVGGAAPH